MARFSLHRKPRLSAAEAAAVALEGARVLAWSSLDGGGVLVVTPEHLLAAVDDVRLRRAWADVDRAEFDNEANRLAVWWVDGGASATVFALARPDGVPEIVHERVRASVVASTQLMFGPGRYVVVALRRGPGDVLSTQVVAGPGVCVSDDEVAAVIAATRARLLEDAGGQG